MTSSNITFTNINNALADIEDDVEFEEMIKSDVESTDVSSIEMTDTETDEANDDMSVDNDDESDDNSEGDDQGVDDKEDKVIEEIRFYQSTTHNLIPFDNFEMLVREIMHDFNTVLDIDQEAVKAIQAAAESYLVELFQMTQRNAIHAQRQVILPKDLQLARYQTKERE
jgi:histone H3/H4